MLIWWETGWGASGGCLCLTGCNVNTVLATHWASHIEQQHSLDTKWPHKNIDTFCPINIMKNDAFLSVEYYVDYVTCCTFPKNKERKSVSNVLQTSLCDVTKDTNTILSLQAGVCFGLWDGTCFSLLHGDIDLTHVISFIIIVSHCVESFTVFIFFF